MSTVFWNVRVRYNQSEEDTHSTNQERAARSGECSDDVSYMSYMPYMSYDIVIAYPYTGS